MITPQLKAIEVKRRGERAGGGGGGLREGKNRDRKSERVRNKGTMGEGGRNGKTGEWSNQRKLVFKLFLLVWHLEGRKAGLRGRPTPKDAEIDKTVIFYQFTPPPPRKKSYNNKQQFLTSSEMVHFFQKVHRVSSFTSSQENSQYNIKDG